MNLALWLKRTTSGRSRCRPSCRRRWHWRRRCTTRRKVRSNAWNAAAKRSRRCGMGACANCTRPSCATTIPRTGRCSTTRLRAIGRADLIGNGKKQLAPAGSRRFDRRQARSAVPTRSTSTRPRSSAGGLASKVPKPAKIVKGIIGVGDEGSEQGGHGESRPCARRQSSVRRTQPAASPHRGVVPESGFPP